MAQEIGPGGGGVYPELGKVNFQFNFAQLWV